MPKIIEEESELEPYWTTTDGEHVKLYHGDVLQALKRLPDASVQMCVTSPPYWGQRDYGSDKSIEIGSEKTLQEFITKMVDVFHEVRRVLRWDGTLWLNIGPKYDGGV